MKTVEERLDNAERELEQIKQVFLIQLKQAKLDAEIHSSLHDIVKLISGKLGVEFDEPVQ